ncbi:hypothetical protein IP83_11315 [Novosphingobium sp. AAP93]|nr:hypothetical protein IP83_11315 [Novosphingobium sp. AAP93]
MVAQGEHEQVYQNLCVALEKEFEIALLYWRQGKSPIEDMKAALTTSQKMLAAIVDWRLNDDAIMGYGDVWNLVRYISYLLDLPVKLPEDGLSRIREDKSQYADVALDYHVLDALEGREWRDGVTELLERLATKKRQMLAAETFRTYFDLLDALGETGQVETLAGVADINYKRRANDPFYGGGPAYMGGGPDNIYVIDYRLAAILKYLEWEGNMIHKWNWCD